MSDGVGRHGEIERHSEGLRRSKQGGDHRAGLAVAQRGRDGTSREDLLHRARAGGRRARPVLEREEVVANAGVGEVPAALQIRALGLAHPLDGGGDRGLPRCREEERFDVGGTRMHDELVIDLEGHGPVDLKGHGGRLHCGNDAEPRRHTVAEGERVLISDEG